jgi:cytochrome P450
MRSDGAEKAENPPDLLDKLVVQCPYPAYEHMREHSPVYFLEKGGFWVVSRMDDIRAVVMNPTIFSSETLDGIGFTQKTREVLFPVPSLIFSDPPQHTRTRSVVERAFTAPRVNAMEGKIQALVDELFDGFIDNGKVEFMSELALPLPLFIIADQLGVPRRDFKQFRIWSNAIAESANPGRTPAEKEEQFAGLAAEFDAYMLERRAEKIAHPAEDIISVLAVATPLAAEEGTEPYMPLTDNEFLSITQILLTAGNETTAAAILSMLHRLSMDSGLLARIKADAGLIKPMIEEVLRLESPVQGFYRKVTQDTDLGGVRLTKGSLVHVRFGSANRDADAFKSPNEFDLSRRGGTPHLAFGAGIHTCIGQMLGRKEMTCVANTVRRRIKSLSLADGYDLQYLPMFNRRSLAALHVEFTRAS